MVNLVGYEDYPQNVLGRIFAAERVLEASQFEGMPALREPLECVSSQCNGQV